MNHLSNRLRTLMCEYQMTLEELASRSGLALETVRNLIYDKAQDPYMNTFLPLCNAFHISPESLSGILTSAPKDLFFEEYYSCSLHGRQLLSRAAALQAKSDAASLPSASASQDNFSKQYSGSHFRRHSGQQILCFCPPVLTASRISFCTCDLKMIPSEYREAYFAVELLDNLFSPYYCRGDILFFADRFPQEGEYALFLFQNEVLFCCFHQEAEKTVLLPASCDTVPITVRQVNQLCVLGTCIGKKCQ